MMASVLTLRKVDKSSNDSDSKHGELRALPNTIKLERFSGAAFLSMAIIFDRANELSRMVTFIFLIRGPIMASMNGKTIEVASGSLFRQRLRHISVRSCRSIWRAQIMAPTIGGRLRI